MASACVAAARDPSEELKTASGVLDEGIAQGNLVASG